MKTVVYPTIFTNGFTVKTAGSSRGHINDAAGKLVKKILLNSGLNSIKLINLACGHYVLVLEDGQEFKIVKQL